MEKNGIIHHIELYVSDLYTSRRFWEVLLIDHLGYKKYQQWERGISYSKGNSPYIVFVQAAKEKLLPAYNRTRVGLNHLAFSISDKKKLAQIRSELNSLGYKELYPEKYPHAGGKKHYALYFEDPDRIKVEVVLEN
ncbi:Glyoxalase bleomycin resistance protein dioxygenase [Liquorilactobacillus aquaticus DSM 21051]|uniref:Glyoxalase bleomycin resistance protein dioxygenase n=1 Tax=Liquorilactobacillus aquaticus DSM 21051 TaxID=1423725 RepID=A0A0R2CZE6_9LACO|nr:Glyoxalase bleomycin resistance protein dioxygenase [Liquorilactobacillus aquaticus DSM 21051]